MSQDDSNPILSRIRKLFALAGSSNEEEAKMAMRKANELLIRHNLDYQKIKMSHDDFEFSKVSEGARAKPHHRFVLDILSSYFFVNIIFNARYDENSMKIIRMANLVGRPVNAQIATHVFEFLDRLYPELWNSFRRSHNVTLKDRHSYYHGLTLGVAYILSQSKLLVEEERGLTLVKDQDLDDFTNDYCSGKVKREKDHKIRKSVKDLGIRDGLKVQIAPPIESKNKQEMLMLEGRA